jgi:hypothetical protein
MVKRLNPKLNGTPNIIRIPTRIPRKVPHPKPGTPRNCAPANNHGDKANPKLTLLIMVDFIPWSPYLRTPSMRGI